MRIFSLFRMCCSRLCSGRCCSLRWTLILRPVPTSAGELVSHPSCCFQMNGCLSSLYSSPSWRQRGTNGPITGPARGGAGGYLTLAERRGSFWTSHQFISGEDVKRNLQSSSAAPVMAAADTDRRRYVKGQQTLLFGLSL